MGMASENGRTGDDAKQREQASPAQSGEGAHATTELDPRLNDLSDYQRCFACGFRNDAGLMLTFHREGEEVVSEWTPDARFAGFPGVVHGGILSTLLDEALSRTTSIEGRWMMTARLEVRFRMPAPLGQALRIRAHAISSRSRMVRSVGEIRLVSDPAVVIAEAEGVFLPLPEQFERESVARFPELASFFAL